MIEIKDVTKSYGRQKVLQNVSFEIMEGELLRLAWSKRGREKYID